MDLKKKTLRPRCPQRPACRPEILGSASTNHLSPNHRYHCPGVWPIGLPAASNCVSVNLVPPNAITRAWIHGLLRNAFISQLFPCTVLFVGIAHRYNMLCFLDVLRGMIVGVRRITQIVRPAAPSDPVIDPRGLFAKLGRQRRIPVPSPAPPEPAHRSAGRRAGSHSPGGGRRPWQNTCGISPQKSPVSQRSARRRR